MRLTSKREYIIRIILFAVILALSITGIIFAILKAKSIILTIMYSFEAIIAFIGMLLQISTYKVIQKYTLEYDKQ